MMNNFQSFLLFVYLALSSGDVRAVPININNGQFGFTQSSNNPYAQPPYNYNYNNNYNYSPYNQQAGYNQYYNYGQAQSYYNPYLQQGNYYNPSMQQGNYYNPYLQQPYSNQNFMQQNYRPFTNQNQWSGSPFLNQQNNFNNPFGQQNNNNNNNVPRVVDPITNVAYSEEYPSYLIDPATGIPYALEPAKANNIEPRSGLTYAKVTPPSNTLVNPKTGKLYINEKQA